MATDTANQAILNRLESMPQFHPLTANLFTDWTLDPGDVVTVRQGETNYTVPIFQMAVDWKGKSVVEVQSTGSEKRPAASILRRGGYGGGRKSEEQEIEMVRYRADIDKSNERIALWATEEEWSTLEEEYQTTHSSQLEVTAKQISSVVTGVEAGTFNKDRAYAIGDITVRNGKVYRFVAPHVAGTDWNFIEVEEAANLYGSLSSHSSRITQTENSISLVVDQNGIRRGQILLAINGEGGSQALIEADNILLSGNTTLDGALTVSGGNLVCKGEGAGARGTFEADTIEARYIDMDLNGTIDTTNLNANNIGNVSSILLDDGDTDLVNGIAEVQIVETSQGSGTYRLQFKRYGDSTWTDDTTTFNRAAASYISGAWSNGVYTAAPDAQSQSTSVTTDLYEHLVSPTQTISGKNILLSGSVYTATVVSGQRVANSATGRTITQTVNASDVWEDGYIEGQTDAFDMYDVVSVTPGTITKDSQGSAIVQIPLAIVVGDDLSGNVSTKNRTIKPSMSGVLQSKTATLSSVAHSVSPDSGYIGLSTVTIPAVALKDWTGDDKITSNGSYTVPTGYDGNGTVEVDLPASRYVGRYTTFSAMQDGARADAGTSTIPTLTQQTTVSSVIKYALYLINGNYRYIEVT